MGRWQKCLISVYYWLYAVGIFYKTIKCADKNMIHLWVMPIFVWNLLQIFALKFRNIDANNILCKQNVWHEWNGNKRRAGGIYVYRREGELLINGLDDLLVGLMWLALTSLMIGYGISVSLKPRSRHPAASRSGIDDLIVARLTWLGLNCLLSLLARASYWN